MTPGAELLTRRGPLMTQDLFVRSYFSEHEPDDSKDPGDTRELFPGTPAPSPHQPAGVAGQTQLLRSPSACPALDRPQGTERPILHVMPVIFRVISDTLDGLCRL